MNIKENGCPPTAPTHPSDRDLLVMETSVTILGIIHGGLPESHHNVIQSKKESTNTRVLCVVIPRIS